MRRARAFGVSVLAAVLAAVVFSGMAAAQTAPVGELDVDNGNAASCDSCTVVVGVEFPNIPSVRFNMEWAQTFSAGRTGALTSVQIKAKQFSNPAAAPLEVTITSLDSTGSPGATLATTSVPASDFTGTFAPVTANFADPARVQAGEGYAMVLSTTDPTAYQLDVSGDTYPSGGMLRRAGSIPWEAVSGLDIKFATYVTPPPVANGDSYTVAEDEPLVVPAPGVLSGDTSVASFALTALKATDPAHGKLVLAPDGSFIYLPDKDFNGTDSFTYRADLGFSQSEPATVRISVTPVAEPSVPNLPPTITGVSPAPRSALRDATPAIRATVKDAGVDLAKGNIRLWVDGKRVRGFSYDRATDRLSFIPKKRMDSGRHTVLIVAHDGNGLSASKLWGFRIKG